MSTVFCSVRVASAANGGDAAVIASGVLVALVCYLLLLVLVYGCSL